MTRIVSVDQSFGDDGKTRHYVTMKKDDGSQERIPTTEEGAEKAKKTLKESNGGGRRLLTEA